MYRLLVPFVLSLFVLPAATFAMPFQSNQLPTSDQSASDGVAVVELFTSQGCSSCPPADKLLRKIAELHSSSDVPVYALSFHVDYWNYLGWKDPYSESRFTRRQRRYAAAWKSDSVYTPQMVVNGREGFVGSKSNIAAERIRDSLTSKATSKVSVSATRNGDKVTVQYNVTGADSGKVLNVAAVERDIQTSVKRGENAGELLRHQNVVRVFRTAPLDKATGSVELTLPANYNVDAGQVIAYVQDLSTLHITGANLAKFK